MLGTAIFVSLKESSLLCFRVMGHSQIFRLLHTVVASYPASVRRLAVTFRHVRCFSKTSKMSYPAIERGSPNTETYRVFFRNENGVAISPFHDIPLYADAEQKHFNMVVEIPRWTNAKMEISKEDKLNPIKQDTKKGKLRYVKNIFPHHGYIWNYGALPQTYENPDHVTPDTGTKGDADPLDVCEIGSKIQGRGSVVKVKALGVMCLIDEGETDWKILAIDVDDPLAEKVNDVSDLEKHKPGLLRATYEWFRFYKVPDGKPVNEFAFEGNAKDREYALSVIDETHSQWKELIESSGESNIARENTSVSGKCISPEDAEAIVNESAEPGPAECLPDDLNTWHHVIE